MTDETDFQLALDRDPTDWFLRMVLSDFLEERGDPRARGYRVLGRLKRWPVPRGGCWAHPGFCSTVSRETWKTSTDPQQVLDVVHAWLPDDWFVLCEGDDDALDNLLWRCALNRQQIEDWAALAFLKLPPERQRELESGP